MGRRPAGGRKDDRRVVRRAWHFLGMVPETNFVIRELLASPSDKLSIDYVASLTCLHAGAILGAEK